MRRAGILGAVAGTILALTSSPVSTAAAAPVAGKSVIGGRLATVAEFPYAAVILRDGQFHCSGAVISPTRILTAGHCARPGAARLSVITGRSALNEGGGEVFGVASAVIHPAFSMSRRAVFNDIAVLALGGTTSAAPASLPGTDADAFTAAGSVLTVVAYGERQPSIFRKSRFGRLAAADLLVRGNCASQIRGFSPDTMICALGRRFGTAVSGRKKRGIHASGCFGDSGAPLIAYSSTGAIVFGVTSFGGISPKKFGFILCGLRRKPGVYTRVSAYLPFIQANL